jgi:hypothetical protein
MMDEIIKAFAKNSADPPTSLFELLRYPRRFSFSFKKRWKSYSGMNVRCGKMPRSKFSIASPVVCEV